MCKILYMFSRFLISFIIFFSKLKFMKWYKEKRAHKQNKSATYGTNARLSGDITLLKTFSLHNSINIDFRVMPLVLQLHLVIMSKYSKFSVETFNTFWVMGYIKVFARRRRWQRRSSDHNSSTFSSEQTSLNLSQWTFFVKHFVNYTNVHINIINKRTTT